MSRILMDIPLRTWAGISPATERLLNDLARGAIADPESEVSRLEQLAENGTADDVRTLALALIAIGRLDEGVTVLQELLETLPDDHGMRLNLAMAHMLASRYELARQEAGAVRATASEPEHREIAQQLLDKIDEAFAALREEHRFERLRLDLIRERAERGEATADERQQMATLLIRLRGEDPRGVFEAIEILEQLEAEHPNDVGIAESLAGALVFAFEDAQGDDARVLALSDRLEGLLSRIERANPDSWIVTAVRNTENRVQDDAGEPLSDPYTERLEWAADVYRRAMDDGPDAASALEELRTLAAGMPEDPNIRGFLMFAEEKAGNGAAALAHANWIAERHDLPHELHFNVVPVFWQHDRARGEHHLRMAMATASDEQERQDVLDLAARLGAPPPRIPDRR